MFVHYLDPTNKSIPKIELLEHFEEPFPFNSVKRLLLIKEKNDWIIGFSVYDIL